MSTIWTPSGEHEPEEPNDENEAAGTAGPAGPAGTAGDPPPDPELEAELRRLQEELAATPVADIVANHAVGLWQLAIVHLAPEGDTPPNLVEARFAIGIVRALRGRVRPGELAAYIEDARNGTWSDSDSGGGPLALYLATSGSDPDGFLTVSTWRDWSSIEKATGGDIHRPLATRHPERIVDFEVALYEAISL